MNLPLLFARRYLFAKRSTNAINIITGISVVGVAIGTAALLLVLSVFNGFEDLLSGLFGHFNPEIKVTAAKGKTFPADTAVLGQLRQLDGVAYVSETLEEIAFFEYDKSQDFGVLKGVDAWFARVNNIDSTIVEGVYELYDQDNERYLSVLGAGLRNKLSVNVQSPLVSLAVYMPVEGGGILDRAYKTRYTYPVGTFAIQQEFDNQYVLASLDFAREILNTDSTAVSALEIRTAPGANLATIKRRVAEIMGENYVVRDHYEQNEAFFKVMKLEKWMGFAITSLMLILMAFNLVGALWMIVLDKQKDISVLKSMGAHNTTVRNIFLGEGMLLTGLGLGIGLALAVLLYWAQKTFDLITIPQGFLVESYPIAMRLSDFLPVVAVVVFIGFLASLAPARRATQVPAYFREE